MFIHQLLRSVLIIVAALLLQASAAGAEESVESGVNRPGRDYKDFAMEPSIAGHAPCQAACVNDSWCRAWTYVKAGVQGPKAHCWLKKSVPEPVKDNCCVSGVSGVISGLEFDSDRPGRDYEDFGISNVDLRTQAELICKSRCEKAAKCRAWTYVKPEREGANARCYLKNAVPARKKSNCCISGVSANSGGGGGQLDPQEVADRDPTGKSSAQCEQSFARSFARCQARFGGSIAMKIGCEQEIQQIRAACLSIAAANQGGGGTTGGGGGGGVPAEWAETLSTHNAKRAMHRTPALSWSSSLAAEAQAWADKCVFKHADFNGFGENLYQGGSATGKAATEAWYAEVKHYDWTDPIGSYNQGDSDKSRETRHFTQVVWKATTQLGCGIKQCGNQKLVVCRYKPPGNFNANNPGVLEENVPR